MYFFACNWRFLSKFSCFTMEGNQRGLEEGGINHKPVGGKLWGDVCRQWWDNFARMCVYAWQTDWLSGGKVGRLHECSIRMGKAHLVS